LKAGNSEEEDDWDMNMDNDDWGDLEDNDDNKNKKKPSLLG